MKNKKFQPLHLLPVIILSAVLYVNHEKPAPEIKREPTSLPKKMIHHPRQTPSPKMVTRGPASVPPPQIDLDRVVKAHKGVSLARGHILAANVGAVPLSEVAPGTSLLWNDGVYAFYEKRPGEKSIPVAFNPQLNKLYPVSSVIHVRQVDESLRQQLKSKGYVEYLYFKSLKKLSLKASPDQVVRVYQDLQKQGYNVKMEVLDNRPVPH